MNNKDKINVGDTVHVDFNGAQTTLCHSAIVLCAPDGNGDFWVFKNNQTNEIHYVSEGCTITKQEIPHEHQTT